MGKIKISSVITAAICAVSISAVSFCSGAFAATGNSGTYKSQGRIVFTNDTQDTADDVIFDASYFQTIHDMVVSGKKLVGTELNKYPSVNIDLTRSVPDFGELAAAIDTLTDDATADGSKMLKDATAYVKGAKINGSIPSKGEATYTPGRSDQTIASGQYLSGIQTIKGDANLAAGNIVEGRTIFGVTGTATAESHIIESSKSVSISDTSGTISPSSGNNAMEQVTYSVSGVDADKIVSGQSILGVPGTVTEESHTALSADDITEAAGVAAKILEAGKTYKIPSGKYADGDMYLHIENSSENVVKSYLEEPTGGGNDTATVSVGIPSDNCIIVFAHPKAPSATSNLEVPTGASILLSNETSEKPNCVIQYYIVKITDSKDKMLSFKFTNSKPSSALYIRYVLCNINASSATEVTNFVKDKYYVIVRNVDYRSIYHDFFSGAVIKYYDMPYTSTYYFNYYMANLSVFKALENSSLDTKSTGNYTHSIIRLD